MSGSPRLRGSAPACPARGGERGRPHAAAWAPPAASSFPWRVPGAGWRLLGSAVPAFPWASFPPRPPEERGAGRPAGGSVRPAGSAGPWDVAAAAGVGAVWWCPGGLAGRGGSCGREPGCATRVAAARLVRQISTGNGA